MIPPILWPVGVVDQVDGPAVCVDFDGRIAWVPRALLPDAHERDQVLVLVRGPVLLPELTHEPAPSGRTNPRSRP